MAGNNTVKNVTFVKKHISTFPEQENSKNINAFDDLD